MFSGSIANAADCNDPNCRVHSQSRVQVQPRPLTSGLMSLFGYRSNAAYPTNVQRYNTGYNQPATQHPANCANCTDGRCQLNGNCVNCACADGNCGPNCRTQQNQYRNTQPLPRPSNDYRESVIQAPRPLSNQYRPVNYNVDVRWENDIRAATDRSRRTGQPMLVQVTATWCGYCKKMKQETYTDRNIAADVNQHFVAVNLDADQNKELVQQLRIESLPTTLIVTADMKIVDRLEGFQSVSQLRDAIRRHSQRAELQTDARNAVR